MYVFASQYLDDHYIWHFYISISNFLAPKRVQLRFKDNSRVLSWEIIRFNTCQNTSVCLAYSHTASDAYVVIPCSKFLHSFELKLFSSPPRESTRDIQSVSATHIHFVIKPNPDLLIDLLPILLYMKMSFSILAGCVDWGLSEERQEKEEGSSHTILLEKEERKEEGWIINHKTNKHKKAVASVAFIRWV